MDMEYLSQAKVRETEREIARIQLEAAAEMTKAQRTPLLCQSRVQCRPCP